MSLFCNDELNRKYLGHIFTTLHRNCAHRSEHPVLSTTAKLLCSCANFGHHSLEIEEAKFEIPLV